VKYVLRKADLSDELEIEISKESYAAYKESRTILSNCLAIEENYEVLILTYLDLERQIFDATASHMVRGFIDPLDAFDVRLALNIRLMSLLTSAQLYTDQFCHQVRECVPRLSDAETLAKSFLSKEYDENPEYRFMEEFRNHVQHCDLPIHWISSGMRWTDLSEDGLLEYSMWKTGRSCRNCFVMDGTWVTTLTYERRYRWEWVCWWGESLMGKSFSE